MDKQNTLCCIIAICSLLAITNIYYSYNPKEIKNENININYSLTKLNPLINYNTDPSIIDITKSFIKKDYRISDYFILGVDEKYYFTGLGEELLVTHIDVDEYGFHYMSNKVPLITEK